MSELSEARQRLAKALDGRNRYLMAGNLEAGAYHNALLRDIQQAQQEVDHLVIKQRRERRR